MTKEFKDFKQRTQTHKNKLLTEAQGNTVYTVERNDKDNSRFEK